MLDEKFKGQIRKKFSSEMKGEAKLILFGEGDDCMFCGEYHQLVEELASLSPNLSPESHPLSSVEKEKHGVELAPSLVVYSEKHGTSATFCGSPGSHFFTTLLEDIVDASRGAPSLPASLLEQAKSIDFPVKLRVFVSQTCSYCPSAVKAAHDLSLTNPKIKAEMVDSALFRPLANKYKVMGVPKTIINDRMGIVGARPPSELISQILSLRD